MSRQYPASIPLAMMHHVDIEVNKSAGAALISHFNNPDCEGPVMGP